MRRVQPVTPDPAVTAAAEAIHVTAFQALGDAAEAVVAAVRPIIEAEVRERIAAENRAAQDDAYVCGRNDERDRIVREIKATDHVIVSWHGDDAVMWRSDAARIAARIRALPAENATGSRDFGRGYASATKDVLSIVEGT